MSIFSFLLSLLNKLDASLNVDQDDTLKWEPVWEIFKYKGGMPVSPKTLIAVDRIDGNMILDNGADAMLKLLSGASGAVPFDTAHTFLGVGDSATAEEATQTGLLGTNKVFKATEAGFPVIEGRSIRWQTTFQEDEAQFKWQEFALKNGDGENAVTLNRKVKDKGTKANDIWVLRLTISFPA